MQLKIQLVGIENNVPDKDRRRALVEIMHKRNETFNVQRVGALVEGGDVLLLEVPESGRVTLTMPEAKPEVVFDPAQNAAVKTRNQVNDADRADAPGELVQKENPAEAQRKAREAAAAAQAKAAQDARDRAAADAKSRADAAAKAKAEAEARNAANKQPGVVTQQGPVAEGGTRTSPPPSPTGGPSDQPGAGTKDSETVKNG
jgi:hypothetical protein